MDPGNVKESFNDDSRKTLGKHTKSIIKKNEKKMN